MPNPGMQRRETDTGGAGGKAERTTREVDCSAGKGLRLVGWNLGQAKERDRKLWCQRRVKGWGRGGDNSAIVRGGVEGQAPWGRKLALFPCTEWGPSPSGELAAS